MTGLAHELRLAIRAAMRRPGYAAAVALTLGLGLGAASGVFSLVNGILLRPLPFRDPEALVGVWFRVQGATGGPALTRQSPATYLFLQQDCASFEALALAERRDVTLSDGAEPVRATAAAVTGSLFEVLGVIPALGRPLLASDGLPGAEPVAVLSDALWSSRFGRDPGILGHQVRIDGEPRRIVGILPRGLAFPERVTQLWVPLTIDPVRPEPLSFLYRGYARLAPGAGPASARAEIEAEIRQIADAYPGFPRPIVESGRIKAEVVPLRGQLTGGVRRGLLLLLGAAGVLLLIAGANVAGLMAVRAESREAEWAVRGALGARGVRLAGPLLAESLVLTLAGGLAGLGLAAAAIELTAAAAPDLLPRLDQAGLDGATAAFALALSLLVAALVGVGAARRAASAPAALALAGAGRTAGARPSRLRWRRIVVAGQVALALALVSGAGLLLRSFAALTRTDPGFEAEGVLALRIALPERDYPDLERAARAFQELTERVREIPGVSHAASASYLPLRDGRIFIPYTIDGRPLQADEVPPSHLTKIVSDGYFETLRIPVVAGRALEAADSVARRDVVVVNEVFASRYWPGGDAVGRRIRMDGRERWLRVVGVVGGVRDRDLAAPLPEIVYVPLLGPDGPWSFARREMSLAVRGAEPGALAAELRRVVHALDPGLPLYDVRTLEEVLSDSVARVRFALALMAAAALSALMLGAVGLYGLLSYVVSERRGEIGLRMALGADADRVRRQVLGQALRPAAAGLLFGLLASAVIARLMGAALYGVPTVDPVALTGASAVVAVVALVAAALPARRASRVDPAHALRSG